MRPPMYNKVYIIHPGAAAPRLRKSTLFTSPFHNTKLPEAWKERNDLFVKHQIRNHKPWFHRNFGIMHRIRLITKMKQHQNSSWWQHRRHFFSSCDISLCFGLSVASGGQRTQLHLWQEAIKESVLRPWSSSHSTVWLWCSPPGTKSSELPQWRIWRAKELKACTSIRWTWQARSPWRSWRPGWSQNSAGLTFLWASQS